MDTIRKSLELDYAYLESFAARKSTNWGSFFYNEDNPNYYDANHASVADKVENADEVIDEVVQFYVSRNLIPRFYIHKVEENEVFISKLLESNFKTEELINPLQCWNHEIVDKKAQDFIQIEKVGSDNFKEALDIECSIKEFGGREVREKAFIQEFQHPAYTHYLLRYYGKAASTACIFSDGTQARLESVATLEKYRGIGLIGVLIHHIQIEAERIGYENLWVFPINETIEKVYSKYGFETLGKMKMIHAYRGGKGILEIREEL